MGKESRLISREQMSIQGEIRYIIEKAQEHDSRAVSMGALVFFSTETGDAWMLDTEDGLAMCLARDGVKQQFSVLETATSFQIDWPATYRIDGDAFIVTHRDGGVSSVSGYPLRQMQALAGRR